MKKTLVIILSLILSIGLTACKTVQVTDEPAAPSTVDSQPAANAAAETLTGSGDGYGGVVTVTITRENGKFTDVKIVGEKETNGIGTMAIDELPDKIKAASGSDVDVVSGATVTSKAIIYAVNNALDPAAYPYPIVKEETAPETITAASVYQGFGLDNSGRIGPGKDDQDVQVYSVNQVLAHALFDADGKILALDVDQIEYATPNYDGETMPHFSGFPGQGGYNMDSDHDEKVDTKSVDTEENFQAEVSSWNTKRDRGDGYKIGISTWTAQMDYFENIFIGMTVAEVEDWYNKYCSDINGRPLKGDSANPEDVTKFGALSADEQAMLVDVVSGATMSLNDAHGNIVAAISDSYKNRVPLDIKSAKGMGIGVNNSGRIGPGKDEKDVSVYSINQIFANTLFDENNRIVAIYVDQLEFATPNYDGDGMPHFSGFPGQNPYNYDEKHDGTISGTITPTEDTFNSEINGWATKRGRGEGYKMGTGTWASQMDAFQKIFIGKTVDEVEEWFKKYTSDINGRPLKGDSANPEDVTKFEALSADEQAMLVDVVSSATMSLNDSHGNIIAAIRSSLDHKANIDLTIG